MNKLVASVFKTIMFAIIFVFAFDIVFYMYRVMTLNQRVESISTSLKKVVMDNNYLPSETADMYSELLSQLICDYNGLTYTHGMTNFYNSATRNNFIAGFRWNYKTPATTSLNITAQRKYYSSGSWHNVTENIVNRKMNTPGDYGDICIVQLQVDVFQPMWGWTPAGVLTSGNYHYAGEDATHWTRSAEFRTTTFVYTYYVPCLNYKTITQ